MRRYRTRRQALGMRARTEWVSSDQAAGGSYSQHRLIEARSLALHCRIAQKINSDPTLLNVAKRNLQAWSAKHVDNPPRYLAEWRRILGRPWPEIAALITEQNEDAVRLRQSSPFAGVLTPAERKVVYDAFRT